MHLCNIAVYVELCWFRGGGWDRGFGSVLGGLNSFNAIAVYMANVSGSMFAQLRTLKRDISSASHRLAPGCSEERRSISGVSKFAIRLDHFFTLVIAPTGAATI